MWMILQHSDSPTALKLWFPPPITHPSISTQTSKSSSFWNSVCIYWSDNTLGDILDIFLRIFAPLGVSWTNWRHKIVITKIIIDRKLISKVVFTATGFPVPEDRLWLFTFPISPQPCLSSPHGEAIHLLNWKMDDGPFWWWLWYSNLLLVGIGIQMLLLWKVKWRNRELWNLMNLMEISVTFSAMQSQSFKLW